MRSTGIPGNEAFLTAFILCLPWCEPGGAVELLGSRGHHSHAFSSTCPLEGLVWPQALGQPLHGALTSQVPPTLRGSAPPRLPAALSWCA